MQGDGAWSSLNLMGEAFLTPHGSPYPLGEVDGDELGEARDFGSLGSESSGML